MRNGENLWVRYDVRISSIFARLSREYSSAMRWWNSPDSRISAMSLNSGQSSQSVKGRCSPITKGSGAKAHTTCPSRVPKWQMAGTKHHRPVSYRCNGSSAYLRDRGTLFGLDWACHWFSEGASSPWQLGTGDSAGMRSAEPHGTATKLHWKSNGVLPG